MDRFSMKDGAFIDSFAMPLHNSGVASSDGGFFILAQDFSAVSKYTSSGELVWSAGPVVGQQVTSPAPTEDGGIIVQDFVFDDTTNLVRLIRFDANGKETWHSSYPEWPRFFSFPSTGVVGRSGQLFTMGLRFAEDGLNTIVTAVTLDRDGSASYSDVIHNVHTISHWEPRAISIAHDSEYRAVMLEGHGQTYELISLRGSSPDRRFVYRVNGVDLAVLETSTKTWERAGIKPKQGHTLATKKISVRNDTITINNYVKLIGDLTIDSGSVVQISGKGKLIAPCFYLRLEDSVKIQQTEVVLYEGEFNTISLLNTASGLAMNKLPMRTKFFGCELALDNLVFLGGTRATGIKISAHANIPNPYSLSKPTLNVYISDLTIKKDTIEWLGQLSNLALAPNWEINNIAGYYSSSADSIGFSALLTLPFLKTVDIRAGIKSGKLSFVETNITPETPVPIGLSGIALTEFYTLFKGLDKPPFYAQVNGAFATSPPDLMKMKLYGAYYNGDSIRIKAEASLWKLPGTEDHQCVFEADGKIRFNRDLTIRGYLRAIEMNGQYMIEGNGNFNYVMKPSSKLAGKIVASVTIPSVPDSVGDLAKWANTTLKLPRKFADLDLQVSNEKLRGKLIIGENLSIGAVINMTRKWGDSDLVSFKIKGVKLPKLAAREKRGNTLADEQMASAQIGMEDEALVIVVSSTSAVSSSSVTAPDGSVYTGASGSNILYDLSTDGKYAFWTIPTAEAGLWKVMHSASDEVSFYTVVKEKPFAVTASVQNSGTKPLLSVSLNEQEANTTTDLFLVPNSVDGEGTYIGSMTDNTSFTRELGPEFDNCTYYLLAVRATDMGVTTVYASNVLTVEHPELPAPANVRSFINDQGRVRVEWEKPLGQTMIAGYQISLADASGRDSLYATIGSESTAITIQGIPGMEISHKVLIQAIDSFGNASCWSEAAPLVLSVRPMHTSRAINGLRVFPNPAQAKLSIDFLSHGVWTPVISVTDVLGHVHMTKTLELHGAGPYNLDLDVSSLARGSYFVRLLIGEQIETVKFVKD